MNRDMEVNCVINMINDLCEEFKIALVPHTIEKGKFKDTQVVAVKDLTNGQLSVMAIAK